MSIKGWAIWRTGFIKNIKYMFASPKRVQSFLVASESCVISLEQHPLFIGWASDTLNMMSWIVRHQLKARLQGNGKDESVLEVTERSYIPCDPFNRFTDEEKNALQPLDELAVVTYDKKLVEIEEKRNGGLGKSLLRTAITGCIFIMAIAILFGTKRC